MAALWETSGVRLVDFEPDVDIAWITMRQGDRLNAINAELASDLVKGLSRAESEALRVVIIRAEAGVKTWSAGHDIGELPKDGQDPLTWTNSLEKLLRKIRSCPLPVIAAVEGGVWGGACELVMSVDLVVACHDSTFAVTPARLGVPYNSAGIAQFMAALPVHIVKEMFLTADPIDAETAYRLGVINRLVPDASELEAAAGSLARRIASRAPLTIRAVKAEIKALTEASPITPAMFEHLTSLRRAAWVSNDYLEGLAAFKERRQPNFTGN